jgi:hypothetical protein
VLVGWACIVGRQSGLLQTERSAGGHVEGIRVRLGVGVLHALILHMHERPRGFAVHDSPSDEGLEDQIGQPALASGLVVPLWYNIQEELRRRGRDRGAGHR